MEIIKTIHELPNWFNLDNYQALTFSEKDLFHQIEYRNVMFRLIEAEIFVSTPETYLGLLSPREESSSFCFKIKQDNPDQLQSSLSISPLSLIEMQWNGEAANKHINSSSTTISAPYKSYDLAFSDETNLLNLSISLNFPDHQIIEELKKLLPTYRNQLNAKKPGSLYKKSDYSKIISYNILPLTDLIIWAKAEGKHIPLSVLAVCLFPDGSKGEEDIRKTIIPFMERVTRQIYVYEWRYKLKINQLTGSF